MNELTSIKLVIKESEFDKNYEAPRLDLINESPRWSKNERALNFK